MKVRPGIVTVVNTKAIYILNDSGFIPLKSETRILDDGYRQIVVAYYALTPELNDYINTLNEFKTIRFKFQKGNDDAKHIYSIFN